MEGDATLTPDEVKALPVQNTIITPTSVPPPPSLAPDTSEVEKESEA